MEKDSGTAESSHIVGVTSGRSTLDATPRVPPWARVLLTVAGMFLAVTLPVPLALIHPVSTWLHSDHLFTYLAAKTLFCVLTLLSYLLIAHLLTRYVDRRPSLGAIGWRARPLDLAHLTLAMLLTIAPMGAALAWGHRMGWIPLNAVTDEGAPLGALLVLAFLHAFVLQGIGEELLWRGYLLTSIQMAVVPAVLLNAFCFALPHLTSQGGQNSLTERFIYLLPPFGFAILAGALVIRTRSLWSAVGVHGGYHIGYALLAGIGLQHSPAFWVLSGLTIGAVGLVILLTLPAAVRHRPLRDLYVDHS
ncbi:hypothetical protein KEM60_01289 [Austwickia sp. TVS 96-490-7B]|uniref:CPBP family intramembrane glutamic endopeptidase n=1 Tax=Austwickia sp. TVS 96-490-7B TaxID=2830843 RepID=UPI001C572B0A|nr:CPBP family intramembrane glutamic endopeptidase [Austwickia sp. TVS 96-490-7B]MBW3085096.1 hypothetical protein [Austwickia sp. TVS 96-490-7B]